MNTLSRIFSGYGGGSNEQGSEGDRDSSRYSEATETDSFNHQRRASCNPEDHYSDTKQCIEAGLSSEVPIKPRSGTRPRHFRARCPPLRPSQKPAWQSLPAHAESPRNPGGFHGGRYWDRTSDLFRVSHRPMALLACEPL